MLKKWEILPRDLFTLLLLNHSEEVLSLCLTNKYFYGLYQGINQPWFEKFSSRLSYLSKSGNYKVKFWEKKYKKTLIQEGVDEKVIELYEKIKNKDEKTIQTIFDEIDLKIVSPYTTKTFFNYLIHYAASKKDQPLLNYLHKRLFEKTFEKSNAIALFHYAVLCNQVNLVKGYLKYTFKNRHDLAMQVVHFKLSTYESKQLPRHKNSPEFAGSPMHIACMLGYKEMVALLLVPLKLVKHSCIGNSGRETPFCFAVKGGYTELFPLLDDLIQQLLQERCGQPLYFAIENEDKATFDALIKLGFKGDWPDCPNGLRPLHLAAQKTDTYFLKKLLEQEPINININLSNYTYNILFPLDVALRAGNVEAFRLLYMRGAKLREDLSLVEEAAQYGKVAILRYLIDELKIKSSLKEKHLMKGKRPIHIAAQFGHAKVVEFFLERMESIDMPDEWNEDTPLTLAARFQSYEVLQLLIERNANLNYRDYEGKTALHYLVSQGFKNASFNGKDQLQFLVTADYKNLPQCFTYIEKLIQKGARIVIEDKEGLTVCDVLIKWKQWELIQQAYDRATQKDVLIIEKKLKNSRVDLVHSIELPKKKHVSPKSSSKVQKQASEEETSCFDFDHPPFIVWFISACIPIFGWIYLIYLSVIAISEYCEEEGYFSLSC